MAGRIWQTAGLSDEIGSRPATNKKRQPTEWLTVFLVETTGLEPVTSCV